MKLLPLCAIPKVNAPMYNTETRRNQNDSYHTRYKKSQYCR